MSAARNGRPVTAGAKCRIATPDTAAVRIAVIGPPSMTAIGSPVVASLRITTALIAGIPRALFVSKPATHFIPTRSSAAVGGHAPEHRRHRVRERLGRGGMQADLRWQFGVGHERGHRAFGEVQPFVEGRHRGEDVRPGEVAKAGQVGHGNESSPPDDLAWAPCPRRIPRRGCAPRASARRPGRTTLAIGTAPTTTATTRSSWPSADPSGSACRRPGTALDLAPGDRLELPAGTSHDAVVGPSGVECLEAHRPAGSLAAPAVRLAGTW